MGIYNWTARAGRKTVDFAGKPITVYHYGFAYKAHWGERGIRERFLSHTYRTFSDQDLETAVLAFGGFEPGSAVYRAKPGHRMPRRVTDGQLQDMVTVGEVELMGIIEQGERKGRGYRLWINRRPAMMQKLSA